MDKGDPIYVTKPFLPPLSEFLPYLESIWESKILTNGGPFHQQLERELEAYLGVRYISLFTNGTLALVTALQALRCGGEVITSPYSFVATTHSLLWNGIQPVFVDVDSSTLNLNPQKIEAAITPRTTAIVPVHCYGQPCDVEAIQQIADRYNLKVIYDAAHAFGVRCKGQSLFSYGDLTILSFHATKVFNTFEGGAIVSPDEKTKQRIDRLKNFGFVDEVTVVAPGINGKMSEIISAVGLAQLKHVEEAIEKRRRIARQYVQSLADVKGLKILQMSGEWRSNCAYCPVIVGDDFPISRDELFQKFRDRGIYARRYFYPLISEFPMYRELQSARRDNLPIAYDASRRILCLPIYPTLAEADQGRVIDCIRGV